jgi:hypothetical protein
VIEFFLRHLVHVGVGDVHVGVADFVVKTGVLLTQELHAQLLGGPESLAFVGSLDMVLIVRLLAL